MIYTTKCLSTLLLFFIFIAITPYSTYGSSDLSIKYVENKYKFIIGANGKLAYAFGAGIIYPVEDPPFTSVGDYFLLLSNSLSGKGKDTTYMKILFDLWTHDYDPNWLHNYVVEEMTNAPEGGALIVMGHISPSSYTPYVYSNTIIMDTGAPFPPWWAQPSSVTVSARTVGEIMCDKGVWELPALVIMFGCNSGGKDGKPYHDVTDTWPWVFRFYVGDAPYYWYGRGFIGFLTENTFWSNL